MRAGGWRQLTWRPNKRAAAADFFESDETSNPMEAEAKRIKAAEERAAAPRTTVPEARLRLALTGRVLQTAATIRPTFEAAPMQHDFFTNPMAKNDAKENTPPPPVTLRGSNPNYNPSQPYGRAGNSQMSAREAEAREAAMESLQALIRGSERQSGDHATAGTATATGTRLRGGWASAATEPSHIAGPIRAGANTAEAQGARRTAVRNVSRYTNGGHADSKRDEPARSVELAGVDDDAD